MAALDRTRGSAKRELRPRVEGLEDRPLMSVNPVFHPLYYLRRTPVAAPATHAQGGTITVASTTTPNPNFTLGPPTPREALKQFFIAKMKGSFVTQPGRFQNQPVQSLILATGGSNQSFHLNAQMQFFLYNDPTVPPDGQIAFSPKNVSSTGNLLVLDLTADPASIVHGLLPTHYTWTVNGGSSGAWQGATGSGTLDVSFNLKNQPRGVVSSGTAAIVATGSIQTNHGLTLDTSAPGNRPKNP